MSTGQQTRLENPTNDPISKTICCKLESAADYEQLQDGSELIVEIDGDWPRSVDGKYDDVRARDLEHRQNEFERSRDDIDRDSLCDDAVSVDENDSTTPRSEPISRFPPLANFRKS